MADPFYSLPTERRARASLTHAVNGSQLPPHSVEAEAGVIGCVILGGRDTFGEAQDLIRHPNEFYDLRHRLIWQEFLEMDEEDAPIDNVTLGIRIRDNERGRQMGGLEYVFGLADQVPSSAAIAYYATQVHLYSRLRRMQAALVYGITEIEESKPGSEGLTLDRIEQSVLDANSEDATSEVVSMSELIREQIDRIEVAFEHRNQGLESGIATGFGYWQKKAGGLQPGNLYLVGGRPSTGKTSLAVTAILNIAKRGVKVGFLSLEMTRGEIALRMLCNEGRANMRQIHSGMITERDKTGIIAAAGVVCRLPVFIDDTPSLTPAGLRVRGRRLVRRFGAQLLVIDHLHEIVDPDHRGDEQKDAKAAVTAAKWLAKVLNVPVLALAQLNREFDKEKTKRKPRMSDLRGHGANEQMADFIGILYRDYDREKESDQNVDENADVWLNTLEICKQRNGPTGSVWFVFDRPTMRYEDATLNTGNMYDAERKRMEQEEML